MPDGSRDLSYLTTEAEFSPISECPWCQSEDLGHLATRGDGLEVKRCNQCQLGFLAELPDDISVFYDEDYYVRSPIPGTAPAVSGYEDYERSFSPSSFRWLTSLIGASSRRPGRLFDLGAATGTFLEMARIDGFDVHGAELTEDGAAAARSKGLDVRSGLFDPSDWDEGSFEVVTALEVLEHVTDLRDVLRGLDRLLADDGILVFFVPNVTKQIVEQYGDDALDFNKSYDHTLFFNPAALTHIFEETFGEGALTLFVADVEQWGQQVSSALGFVRKQPIEDSTERRLLDVVRGVRGTDGIETKRDAIAVALAAAKFFDDRISDQAVDVARDLGATETELATVEAQILRNRGEVLSALEILEARILTDSLREDPLAAALFLETLADFTTLLGILEPGAAAGMRSIHEKLEGSETLRRAIDRIEAQEADLMRRASVAEDRASAAEDRASAATTAASAAESERDRADAALGQAHVELAHIRSEFADAQQQAAVVSRRQSAELAERDERVRALDGEVARVGALLDEIYSSRAWKSIGTLRGAKRRIGSLSSRSTPADDVDDFEGFDDLPALAPPSPGKFPVAISVIMPVYNKGTTMRDSIDSVFAQTLQDFEIIVWDDGSTDQGTLELLDELAALDRITVVHASNQGVVGARNSAMRLAQGEFLVCLDPDDRFRPTYLEKAVLYLRSHPDVSIVYPWQQTVGAKEERWQTHDLDPTQIAFSNHLPVCSVLRREVFTETGGFSQEMSGGVEDWELWTHAADLGFQGRVIPELLFEYSYSDDPNESRDATARDQAAELADRIRTLHPTVAAARPRPAADDAVPNHIVLAPPAFPAGTGRPVIIFVPWFTVGGADRVVKELVGHWTEQGRTVVAITTLGVVSSMEDRLNDLLTLTPYVYQLPSILPMHLWYQFVDRVLTALPETSILNIGSTWFHDHAAKLKRSHPDVRIIDQQFNDSGHIEGNQIALPAIDLTVTAYEGLQSSFLADGRTGDTVTNIYVGIEPAEVGAADVATTMAEIGVEPGGKYVAFVGRLSEEKRPEWLFPLADTLHARDVDVVVVGTGPLAERLGDDLESHPGIVWIQHVEDTAPVFAGAEATVLPSRIEGIPLTAMESLAVGTPVIATAVGGLPELEDVSGVHLVDPDDRLAFVKATTAVLDTSPHESISLPDELTLHGMIERYDAVIDPSA